MKLTVRVTDEVYEEIQAFRRMGETQSDVVRELLRYGMKKMRRKRPW